MIATTLDTTLHFDNLPMTSTTITTTTTPTLESGHDAVLNHRLDSMSLEGNAKIKHLVLLYLYH